MWQDACATNPTQKRVREINGVNRLVGCPHLRLLYGFFLVLRLSISRLAVRGRSTGFQPRQAATTKSANGSASPGKELGDGGEEASLDSLSLRRPSATATPLPDRRRRMKPPSPAVRAAAKILSAARVAKPGPKPRPKWVCLNCGAKRPPSRVLWNSERSRM
jgi:hypothetical protein